MSNLADLILPIAGILLGFHLLKRVLVARNLARLRILLIRSTTRDVGETPPHLAQIFGQAGAALAPMGFTFQRAVDATPATEGESPAWSWVFRHEGELTSATVRVVQWPDAPRRWTVQFSTLAEDGAWTLSSDHPASPLLVDLPRNQVLYLPWAEPTTLWESHLARVPVRELRRELSAAESAETHDRSHLETLEYNRSLGNLRAADSGDAWSCPPLRAFLIAPKLAAVSKHGAKAVPGTPPPLPSEGGIESDTQAFLEQRERMKSQGLSGTGKLILLVVSLALFLLSFGIELSWATSLPILLCVLTFHEGGHLLGMRLFGYKNLSMLYLPFLGAVAIGTRQRVAPWKEVVVLLLGPLPGLFIGIALALFGWAQDGWRQELVIMLIGLNVFNLIPIHPLDGGQILSITLFSRFPRLRSVFSGVSALLLIGLGFSIESTALGVFGLLMLLPIVRNFRAAKIESDIRREVPHTENETESSLVRRVFERAAARGYYATSFTKRYLLVNSALPHLQQAVAGPGTMAFAALAYLSPIWLSLLVAFPIWRASQEARITAIVKQWDDSDLRMRLFPKNPGPERLVLLELADRLDADPEILKSLASKSEPPLGDSGRLTGAEWLDRLRAALDSPAAIRGELIPAQGEYSGISESLISFANAKQESHPELSSELSILAWRVAHASRTVGGSDLYRLLSSTESRLFESAETQLGSYIDTLEPLLPTEAEGTNWAQATRQRNLATYAGVDEVTGEFAPRSFASEFDEAQQDEFSLILRLLATFERWTGFSRYIGADQLESLLAQQQPDGNAGSHAFHDADSAMSDSPMGDYELRTVERLKLARSAFPGYRHLLQHGTYPAESPEAKIRMVQSPQGWFLEVVSEDGALPPPLEGEETSPHLSPPMRWRMRTPDRNDNPS